jgi:hypothetical protein
VQLVFQERFAEFLLNQALALAGVLPVREANLLHDLVDVGNDAFDDDVSVFAFGFGEEFGGRLLGPVTLFFRICFLFCFNDFLGDFENLLEKFQACEETQLMAFLDFLKTHPKLHKLGIAQMLAQPGNQHDLNLAAPLLPVDITQDLTQHLGIQKEWFYVVLHRYDVDILVDEIHSFGTQALEGRLKYPLGSRHLLPSAWSDHNSPTYIAPREPWAVIDEQ